MIKRTLAFVAAALLATEVPAEAYTVISANTWAASQGINADLANGTYAGSAIPSVLSSLSAIGVSKIRTAISNAGATCPNGAPPQIQDGSGSTALTGTNSYETVAAAGVKMDIILTNQAMTYLQVQCYVGYAATVNAAYPGSIASIEGVNESNNQTGTNVAISSGTYNSTTGVVTLTVASSTLFASQVATTGLTGTGAIGSLDGAAWTVISGGTGTTVSFQGPTGLGSITITGGTATGGYYIAFQDSSNNITFGDIAAFNMIAYIYAQVKANASLGSGVRVLDYTTSNASTGGTLYGTYPNPYPPTYSGTSFADSSNFHQYAYGPPPGYYGLMPYQVDGLVSGAVNNYVTEYGAALYPGNTAGGTEAVSAAVASEQMLDYMAQGSVSFRFQLFENGNGWGDFYSGSESIHAFILGALNSIVASTNSAAPNATPTISASASLSGLTQGNIVQVGKDLIIWAEPTIINTAANTPCSGGAIGGSCALSQFPSVNVTINLGGTYNASVYDPTAGATVDSSDFSYVSNEFNNTTATTPTHTYTGVTAVTVAVGATPIVISLSGGSGATNVSSATVTPAPSSLVNYGIVSANVTGTLTAAAFTASMYLENSAAVSTLTVLLPPIIGYVGQTFSIGSLGGITTLTLETSAGGSISGAPTSIAAGGHRTMWTDGTTWYPLQ